jgi:hypothetical protein
VGRLTALDKRTYPEAKARICCPGYETPGDLKLSIGLPALRYLEANATTTTDPYEMTNRRTGAAMASFAGYLMSEAGAVQRFWYGWKM